MVDTSHAHDDRSSAGYATVDAGSTHTSRRASKTGSVVDARRSGSPDGTRIGSHNFNFSSLQPSAMAAPPGSFHGATLTTNSPSSVVAALMETQSQRLSFTAAEVELGDVSQRLSALSAVARQITARFELQPESSAARSTRGELQLSTALKNDAPTLSEVEVGDEVSALRAEVAALSTVAEQLRAALDDERSVHDATRAALRDHTYLHSALFNRAHEGAAALDAMSNVQASISIVLIYMCVFTAVQASVSSVFSLLMLLCVHCAGSNARHSARRGGR